jgi:hypothetical protein
VVGLFTQVVLLFPCGLRVFSLRLCVKKQVSRKGAETFAKHAERNKISEQYIWAVAGVLGKKRPKRPTFFRIPHSALRISFLTFVAKHCNPHEIPFRLSLGSSPIGFLCIARL